MYKSKVSDRYFELKERLKKLTESDHTVAYAAMKCGWCFGSGSVRAVTFHNINGMAERKMIDPTELLPCVCSVGWPYYGGESFR